MKRQFYLSLILFVVLIGCNGQTNNSSAQQSSNDTSQPVGGGCDGCELMYVGMPANLNSSDTSAGWNEIGQKLIVTGTVYKLDGKTPAPGVIVYYWHTDSEGLYSSRPGQEEKAKIHGHLRGWIKTDQTGKYLIYTVRPASYPNTDLPAHIHLSIKEPDVKNEYYPDDINFVDDKLLAPFLKKYPQSNRGGSGVASVSLKNNIQIAEHNIILGLNIPNYPQKP